MDISEELTDFKNDNFHSTIQQVSESNLIIKRPDRQQQPEHTGHG